MEVKGYKYENETKKSFNDVDSIVGVLKTLRDAYYILLGGDVLTRMDNAIRNVLHYNRGIYDDECWFGLERTFSYTIVISKYGTDYGLDKAYSGVKPNCHIEIGYETGAGWEMTINF